MTIDYNPMNHPLADGTKKVEVDGKVVETINTWSFASMVVHTICDPLAPIERPDGLKNAESMARDAIATANPNININKLLAKCKDKNQGAIRQAIALIASGVEAKMDEAFKNKK